MSRVETTLPVRWVELLSSRLCHDLISPVSAIGNGVELIEEMGGDMLDDALALIGDSARRASGRLSIFRIALGTAGGQAGLEPADVLRALEAAFDGGKVSLSVDPPVAERLGTMPDGAGKLLACLVLVAEETVPFGGRIDVTTCGTTGLQAMATGRRAGFEHGNDAALAGTLPEADLGPRTILSAVVARLALCYGFGLAASAEAERVVLSAAPASPQGSARFGLPG